MLSIILKYSNGLKKKWSSKWKKMKCYRMHIISNVKNTLMFISLKHNDIELFNKRLKCMESYRISYEDRIGITWKHTTESVKCYFCNLGLISMEPCLWQDQIKHSWEFNWMQKGSSSCEFLFKDSLHQPHSCDCMCGLQTLTISWATMHACLCSD